MRNSNRSSKQTAADRGPVGFDVVWGNGLVDPWAAALRIDEERCDKPKDDDKDDDKPKDDDKDDDKEDDTKPCERPDTGGSGGGGGGPVGTLFHDTFESGDTLTWSVTR